MRGGATFGDRPRIRERGRRLPLQVRRRPVVILAKIFGDLQGKGVRASGSGSGSPTDGVASGFGLADVLRDAERQGGFARSLNQNPQPGASMQVAVGAAGCHGYRLVALLKPWASRASTSAACASSCA